MCIGARIIPLIILLLFMQYVCSSHNHWLHHSATFDAWPVCCMPPSPNAVLLQLLLKGGHGIFNMSNNLSVSCAAVMHALWQERHWWVYTSADSQKRSLTLSQQGLEPTAAHFTGLPLPLTPVQQAKPLIYSLPPEAWLSMHSACTLTLRMHRLSKHCGRLSDLPTDSRWTWGRRWQCLRCHSYQPQSDWCSQELSDRMHHAIS